MELRALTCDTYGTIVDWRGTILDELRAFGQTRGLDRDWEAFLTDWKSCYRAGMDMVNGGEWPWTTIDTIYRRRLDELLRTHGIAGVGEHEVEDLNRVWWRLRPWPDSVAGLTRLRRRYIIAPLSNASFAGMVNLARSAGLPWDCVLTAENARRYKPAPEVYRTAIELLGLRPGEVMMVAAHNYDLAAARSHGMRTAFEVGLESSADPNTVLGSYRDVSTIEHGVDIGTSPGPPRTRRPVHRVLGSTGCITLFTTDSPILSPMSVPTRVEKR